MDNKTPGEEQEVVATPQQPSEGPTAQGEPTVATTRAEDVPYSDEVAEHILSEVAGGRSLKRVLDQDPGMPSRTTFYRWLKQQDGFKELYEIALTDRADALADDIGDIADDVRLGKLEPDKGRVAGDLKKWSASKLRPKKYGDHVDVTTGGEKLGFDISPDQAAQLVAARADRSNPA